MLDEQLRKIKLATRDPECSARHRPGRHRHFVPGLLRRDTRPAEQPLIEDDQDPDQLKSFTGVMVEVGLSVPMWIFITWLLYYLI